MLIGGIAPEFASDTGMQQFGEVGDMAVRGFGYSENGVDSKNSSRLS